MLPNIHATSTSEADTAALHHLEHEAEAAASGALAGAALGAFAGPPGIVAGAVMGGVAAALAESVLGSDEDRRVAHERELDADPPKTDVADDDLTTDPDITARLDAL